MVQDNSNQYNKEQYTQFSNEQDSYPTQNIDKNYNYQNSHYPNENPQANTPAYTYPNPIGNTYANEGYPNAAPNNIQDTMQGNSHQYANAANTSSSFQNTNYGGNTGNNAATGGSDPRPNNEQFLLFSLIIAISITAIVIGVGWMLFYPKPMSEQVESPKRSSRSLSDLQSKSESDTQDLIIVYGAEENDASDASNKKTSSTITKKPVTSSTSSPKAKENKEPVASTASKTSSPAVSKATTVAAKPSTVTLDTRYWIQIFSTNNRDKANRIQNDLDTQGIKAIIITKNINNSIFYRLRIGPYYNKDEGSKFLEWIKRNAKYRDAYISVEKG